jgi:hypothetical protein
MCSRCPHRHPSNAVGTNNIHGFETVACSVSSDSSRALSCRIQHRPTLFSRTRASSTTIRRLLVEFVVDRRAQRKN